MLRIRKEQMHILSDITFINFKKRMVKHLELTYHIQTAVLIEINSLGSWVDRNVHKAQELGFQTEQDICRFLNVAMVHGEAFIKTPWASSVLAQDVFSSTKASMLELESSKQINNQYLDIQEEARLTKHSLLERFAELNTFKVSTIGPAVFNLNLLEEEIEGWLLEVGNNCLDYQLYDDLEMDLWLDLSMQNGKDFFLSEWAKKVDDSNLSPQDKLQYFVEHQPKDAVVNP